MNIRQIESSIAELLAGPAHPLSSQQRQLAHEYAAGLFEGAVDGLRVASGVTLQQVQGMHALSHKMAFFVGYFLDAEGRADAQLLDLDAADEEAICSVLVDTARMKQTVDGELRKQIAERSANWARAQLVAQLAQPAQTDQGFRQPAHITVNYEPEAILAKAEAVRAYIHFYQQAQQRIASEPDTLLAAAKQALLYVHAGRLNAMAAVDVFPALLSLGEQLSRTQTGDHVAAWRAKLLEVAPAVGRIYQLEGDERQRAREAYVRHLDAIRQGAPLELDDINGEEAALFGQKALDELSEAVSVLQAPQQPEEPTELAKELHGLFWTADDVREFIEAVLREWGMLSQHTIGWQEADDRQGFAPDSKFQVVVTPRRKNMSVDSTRRIVNIPFDTVRPLVGLYPAGALPMVAHELSHVLQGYADYELGLQVPLARVKGRRYRILREAGGVYQERILCQEYFGMGRRSNTHYLEAYIAKMEGANRVQVARAFYESTTRGQKLTGTEDEAARTLAINRTSRLYRYGGHNSQVLDYVEQSVVCDVLLQYLAPEQVDAFLLGSSSFSLEDSVLLHRYGLLTLPTRAILSPAHEVMRVFAERFRTMK